MKFIQTIRNVSNQHAIVLMYHRIAEIKTDPWQLAVSPHNFEEQLRVLQKKYEVISVDELVQRVYHKSLSSKCICLTFDDGYSDNFFAAKPLLEKYADSATFFIASQYINSNNSYWWDELEAIILKSPRLPSFLHLIINGNDFSYHVNDSALNKDQIKQHQDWVWPAPTPTDRCSLYLDLWERIRPLPYSEINCILYTLKKWAQYTPTEKNDSIPMTSIQLKTLAAHPLFTIGLHTVTHPALAFHSHKTQSEEIAGNSDWIEAFINKKPDIIAYPYGNFNEVTVQVLKEQRIKAGFTTEGKLIDKNASPYSLGRFQVKNWNGEVFERQLYEWARRA